MKALHWPRRRRLKVTPITLPLPGGPVETVVISIPADHLLARTWAENEGGDEVVFVPWDCVIPGEDQCVLTIQEPGGDVFTTGDPGELLSELRYRCPSAYGAVLAWMTDEISGCHGNPNLN
jgi:hypothetical protein